MEKYILLMVVGLYIISPNFSVEFVIACSLLQINLLRKCPYDWHNFILESVSLGCCVTSRNIDSTTGL